MASQQTQMNLLSCDAGGVTFAVSMADVNDAGKTDAVLAQWQSATLTNIKAGSPVSRDAFKVSGLATDVVMVMVMVMVKATGQRVNGQAVSSQAAYFAQDSRVFQAVMYVDIISPDLADTFFSGLKFE